VSYFEIYMDKIRDLLDSRCSAVHPMYHHSVSCWLTEKFINLWLCCLVKVSI